MIVGYIGDSLEDYELESPYMGLKLKKILGVVGGAILGAGAVIASGGAALPAIAAGAAGASIFGSKKPLVKAGKMLTGAATGFAMTGTPFGAITGGLSQTFAGGKIFGQTTLLGGAIGGAAAGVFGPTLANSSIGQSLGISKSMVTPVFNNPLSSVYAGVQKATGLTTVADLTPATQAITYAGAGGPAAAPAKLSSEAATALSSPTAIATDASGVVAKNIPIIASSGSSSGGFLSDILAGLGKAAGVILPAALTGTAGGAGMYPPGYYAGMGMQPGQEAGSTVQSGGGGGGFIPSSYGGGYDTGSGLPSIVPDAQAAEVPGQGQDQGQDMPPIPEDTGIDATTALMFGGGLVGVLLVLSKAISRSKSKR